MKKTFKTLLFVVAMALCLAIPTKANMYPYLTCNPYPATVNGETVTFTLGFDGQSEIDIPATPAAQSGYVIIDYDLSKISNGQHTVYARAKTADGLSAPTSSITFNKNVPAVPINIGLTNQ
jgi:hypothetical protein